MADQKLLLYTKTDSHNFNFTKSCYLVSEAMYLRGMSCAQQLPPPSPSILHPPPPIKGIVLGLIIFNTTYENLCWRFEDRLPKTGATGRQE